MILVRHAEAAAVWGSGDDDPGLSELGRQQAAALAYGLSKGAPRPLVVSPLRRARETAEPLARAWGVVPAVEPGVGEVPTPAGVADRMAWLRGVLSTAPSAWPEGLQAWRSQVVSTLCSLPDDAVVVTHFVLITVAAGVDGYRPDHCSQTIVSVAGGSLSLVALGASADATVVR